MNSGKKTGFQPKTRQLRRTSGLKSFLKTISGIAITLFCAVSVIAVGFLLVWITHLIFG